MQTFMTHMSYGKTAAALDDVRLGNQRNEALIILDNITGVEESWPNHPALRAWEGYELSLAVYGMMMCLEWAIKRRHSDVVFWKFKRAYEEIRDADPGIQFEHPPWMRDTDYLRTHRSNLIRKDKTRYGAIFPNTPDDMPYLWPFTDGEGGYTLRLSAADKARLKAGERRLPDAMMERVANR